MKRLYIMDSTTISLFKHILKDVERTPRERKRKGFDIPGAADSGALKDEEIGR